MAFVAYKESRFSDAADSFHEAAKEAEINHKDPSIQALILANAASCEMAMELNRRCLKTCDLALSKDPNCLKALLIKGKVQVNMGKKGRAITTWKGALSLLNVESYADIDVFNTIATELKKLESPQESQGYSSTNIPDVSSSQVTATPPPPPTKSGDPATTVISLNSSITPGSRTSLSSGASSSNDTLRKEALAAPVAASALAAALQCARASGIRDDNPALAVTEMMLAQARSVLSHSSGIASLDNAIARGYLFVNTGIHGAAIALFDVLLASYPGLIACYMAKGSACAMTGDYGEAVKCFTQALAEDPTMFDAWKRRGQTQAARGNEFLPAALADLDQAKVLAKGRDEDIVHQRGAVLHRMMRYREALEEFDAFVKLEPNNAIGHNYIGLCRAQLGDYEVAFEAYKTAMKLDPKFREAKVNLAQLYRECGDGSNAIKMFDLAMKSDPTHVQSLHLRGLCKHGLGQTEEAVVDFEKVVRLDNSHKTSLHMLGLCLQSLGQFHKAMHYFKTLLQLDPAHVAFYNIELGCYYLSTLDDKMLSHKADDDVNALLKELQCKRLDHREHLSKLKASLTSYESVKAVQDVVSRTRKEKELQGQFDVFNSLIKKADQMGKFLVLDCKGFLANQRQQRQAGLAILQISETCRSHFNGIANNNIPEDNMKWRDVFDIAVRWRQISEPNDPVWWIDKLSKEAFAEGFGLQTPLINGQLKVIRYYPYFKLAFTLMKELIIAMMDPGQPETEIIRNLKSVDQLYRAWGKGDFWVVSPCRSTATPGKTFEGTRLTIQRKEPNGYEFTIRTPGTPDRWLQYSAELEYFWNRLQNIAKQRFKDDEAEGKGNNGTTLDIRDQETNEIVDVCLSIFFYWVNFGPLSRGSAACGYVVLNALLLSFGYEVELPWMPPQIQMDWEAILRPTPQDFISVVKPWMLPKLKIVERKPLSLSGGVTNAGASDDVDDKREMSFADVVVTLRDAYVALNAKAL